MGSPVLRSLLMAVLAGTVLCTASAAGAAPVRAPGAAPPPAATSERNGMIFVHGFQGSGAQFESQKMRFTSNGHPGRDIQVLEYDSTFATESRPQIYARLDAMVAKLKQQTGRPQVDLLGHSLGTSLSQDYLSSPERAEDIQRYVNIDGREAEAPPGGVPTLAIWAGRGDPGRSVEGAENVTIPNQTHVEVATSAEAFAEMYRFFTGNPPATSRILPEHGSMTIAGRAVLFPHNRGNQGTRIDVWRVDGATGHRTGDAPVTSFTVSGDGSWGPLPVRPRVHYEFSLTRPGLPTLHYYYEPFIRSDHLLRLLDAPAMNAVVDKSDRHVAGVVIRYKELWGDQGEQNDVLTLNGTNVCNAATCPINKRVNAVFAFDRGSDGRTDLDSPHPVFGAIPFLTGVDIFMPATTPPTGTVTFGIRSRGEGPTRLVNVPDFASSTDFAIVQLNDFE